VRIEILLFPGFDEMDAIGPYEVLRFAADQGDFQVELVTLDDLEVVEGSHGLRVLPHRRLDPDSPPDILIVPGGGWNNRAPQGAHTESQRPELAATLRRLQEQGATLASVCTGGMVLASAGLVEGRPAITHRGAIEDLRAHGAQVIEARVVVDDNLITGGGVTSGLDLALWLVERHLGPDAALEIEREMEYERRGIVWRRS
jgi:transcriptional regulator GlxA family with amidase domain